MKLPAQSIRGMVVLTIALVLSGGVVAIASPQNGFESAGASVSVPLPESVLWLSLVCFLALSAFWSAAETALFSLTKVQLHRLEESGRRGYHSIRRLLDEPNDTLITILASNTFVNIAATLSGAALVERHLSAVPAVSFIVGAAGVTLIILIFGEITPKTFAIERAEGLTLRVAPVVVLLSRALTPVRRGTMTLTHAFFRLLSIPAKGVQDSTLSEEELRVLLTFGEVGTILEEDEQEMIESVLELGETMVEEVMTPRIWIEGFPVSTPQEEMLAKVKHARHTRVLVYDRDLDHILGVLYAKDFLLNPDQPFREVVRQPLLVPAKKKLIHLLQEFKRQRSHFAVVVDEYGGTAGLVTMHDLLEEIVGEIRDRGQKGTLEEIIRISDEEFLIPGKTEIWILNEELGLQLPEDMGRTLSGFIINSLGHFPQQYETVDWAGYRYRFLRVEHRRIVHVHVKKLPAEATTSEEHTEP